MTFRKASMFVTFLTVLPLVSVGCATKKHVREAIAPVQNQVNQTQGQVSALEKQTADNKQEIVDLDRQVSAADEKAVDANNRATAAADAAASANSAAAEAGQRADTANSVAQQAQQGVTQLDQWFSNIDNYKLLATEQVYFGLNRSSMSKDEQAKLDEAIQKVADMKNYIIEVEGYADRTGDSASNRELSRKRADAVVHYLAVEHDIPLRSIRELGAGADFPDADNRTRAARKENRRVDVKIYTLDLGSETADVNTNPQGQR